MSVWNTHGATKKVEWKAKAFTIINYTASALMMSAKKTMDLVGATIILIQCKKAAVDLFVGDSVKRKTDSKKGQPNSLLKRGR